jgi:Fe-Mn family superoxide dismutase
MTYKLPPLGYAYDALEPYIDAKTMEIHHTKHHQGYIDKLNTALKDNNELSEKPVEELLKDFNSIPEEIKNAIRNNGGGHANHSLFWEILRVKGDNNKPSEKILDKINNKFGSFEEFKEQFTKTALGRFGSGWIWLIIDKTGELKIIDTQNQDSPLMEDLTPILGLDVWEHAYYLKYQNRRQEYIENFFKIINWDKVNENFENFYTILNN